MLVFYTDAIHKEFWVKYLVIFYLFSRIDGFKWHLIGGLCKNIQLMLEFLKVLFLVLHFLYYILLTFLMIFSVRLLSMLMRLMSDTSHLIYGNNLSRLPELNSDLCNTVFWVRKWLVDFNNGKTQLVSFHQSNNSGATDVK